MSTLAHVEIYEQLLFINHCYSYLPGRFQLFQESSTWWPEIDWSRYMCNIDFSEIIRSTSSLDGTWSCFSAKINIQGGIGIKYLNYEPSRYDLSCCSLYFQWYNCGGKYVAATVGFLGVYTAFTIITTQWRYMVAGYSSATSIWARLAKWVQKPWLLLGKCFPSEGLGWHMYETQHLPIYNIRLKAVACSFVA